MASEEVDRHGGGRVAALHLKLGALSGVVKEASAITAPRS